MRDLFRDSRLVVATALIMAIGLLDGFEALVLGLLAPAIGRDLNIALPFFTWIFFATSVGTMSGSMLAGLLADRYGRRKVLIMAALAMAVGMIGDGLSPNWEVLLIARAFAGMGLGAVLPAGTTLIAELAPVRYRAAIISVIVVSTTIGGASSAFSIHLMERLTDWRGIFIAAGVLSAVIALAMYFWLPESPTFLAKGAAEAQNGERNDAQKSTRGATIMRVFAEGRAVGALILCLFFFSYYIWLGFHRSWGPLVYGAEGANLAAGRTSMALYGTGVIAGAALAPILALRWREQTIIKLALAVGGLCLVALATAGGTSGTPFTVLWLLAGCSLYLPFQLGYGVATSYFPAHSRSMGVALVAVCGRLGSLSGPLFGGALVAVQSSSQTILIAAALPIALAFAVLLGLRLSTKGSSAA